MGLDELLEEAALASPEQWETDPFGCAAAIIRAAADIGMSYCTPELCPMSDGEYQLLMKTRRQYS
jgi:hypothetical protein